LAIRGDGTANYAAIPHNAAYDFSILQAFSFSFWAKVDLSNTSVTRFVSKAISNAASGWQISYDASSGTIRFQLQNNSTAEIQKSVIVPDQNWHHYVFSKSAGTITNAYLDGVVNGSPFERSITGTITNSIAINLLCRGGTPAAFWKGYLKELRFYNVELSAADALQLFTYGSDPQSANLKLYMPMSEGSGTVLVDHSSVANNGALSGSNYWNLGSSSHPWVDFSVSSSFQITENCNAVTKSTEGVIGIAYGGSNFGVLLHK
jgi:hypothetical protein